MRQRVVVALAVLTLFLAFIIVQLADPRLNEQSPPDVDFSEPPAEIAADSATQFEYVDYSYRIDFARNRSGPWRQVRTMQIDNSDHEFYKTGPNGEDGVVIYGTDAVTFVRPGPNSKWRITPDRKVLYDPKVISQPFDIEEIRDSPSIVVSRKGEYLRIGLPAHPLRVDGYLPGNATILVNRSSGIIMSAHITYHPTKSRTLYLRFSVTNTNINVARPRNIPPSPREVFWDAIRGPVIDL